MSRTIDRDPAVLEPTLERTIPAEQEHVFAVCTRAVLSQAGFETQESRDGHHAGWSSALDRLRSLFPVV